MEIAENEYIKEMRQRLGLEEGDTSKDAEIESMPPMERVALIVGWEFGDSSWTRTFKNWLESQGLYITTDPNANGVIKE